MGMIGHIGSQELAMVSAMEGRGAIDDHLEFGLFELFESVVCGGMCGSTGACFWA